MFAASLIWRRWGMRHRPFVQLAAVVGRTLWGSETKRGVFNSGVWGYWPLNCYSLLRAGSNMLQYRVYTYVRYWPCTRHIISGDPSFQIIGIRYRAKTCIWKSCVNLCRVYFRPCTYTLCRSTYRMLMMMRVGDTGPRKSRKQAHAMTRRTSSLLFVLP